LGGVGGSQPPHIHTQVVSGLDYEVASLNNFLRGSVDSTGLSRTYASVHGGTPRVDQCSMLPNVNVRLIVWLLRSFFLYSIFSRLIVEFLQEIESIFSTLPIRCLMIFQSASLANFPFSFIYMCLIKLDRIPMRDKCLCRR
jgi:hypothetical protein